MAYKICMATNRTAVKQCDVTGRKNGVETWKPWRRFSAAIFSTVCHQKVMDGLFDV